LRLNYSQTVFEANRNFLNKVKVGTNLNYTRGKNSGVDTNSEFGSILGSALAFVPYLPVYADDPAAVLAAHPYAVTDKDGRVFTIPPSGFQEIANPVAMLYQPNSSINTEDVFVTSFWSEIDILPGLKFRSSYSADMSFWGNDSYNFPYFLAIQGKDLSPDNASISSNKNRRYAWQTENYFSFDKTFAEVHNIQLMAGQSAFKSSQSNLSGSRVQPNTYDPAKAFLNNTPENWEKARVNGGVGDATFHSLTSYFGRFNYNFAERYILSASVRRDGSSRFGPNNKWATLPAGSVAWNITNEPFLQSVSLPWLDVAKLRVSWGRNGNESIGDLRYENYDSTGSAYDFYYSTWSLANGTWGGNLVSGTTPGALANPSIRWEESEQTDLGLDLRFFKNALSFTADYYKKKTIGMLMTQPIPNYVGQGAPIANIGKMENSGIEFELGWKNRVGKFNYYFNANTSFVKTTLIEYGNASGIQTNMENQGNTGVGEYMRGSNGKVYPYFFGLKTNGLFQNWDEINNYTYASTDDKGETVIQLVQPNAKPGDVRFVDLNGDGSITDDDKTKIGKPTPDWVFGFTAGADWKGFDASFFFQGSYGNDIFEYAQRSDVPSMNRPEWILQRWHGEGTSTTIPRLTSMNENKNWNSSDLYIKDGSYIRLKTAQIGYTLPSSITKKASVQKLRLFVAAENLLTFTKYDGFDVEMGDHGVDRGIYPQSRTISVGAGITF
jgi:TonB-linked SusC/RagA family outer membrane protein